MIRDGDTAAGRPSTRPGQPSRFGPFPRELGAFLELATLSGFAVAQPTFDLLGKNAELFSIRRAGPVSTVLLTLMILLVPPLVLWCIEAVSALGGWTMRRLTHVVLCGALAALFLEQLLHEITGLGPRSLLVIAVAGGVLFTIFRWSTAQLGRVLRVLVIAPLAFAVAFVGFSPASDVVFGGGASSAGAAARRPSRLVMVVFDELPLATLLDGQGAIDAALFPNFAALARTSSWFRNTTTVSAFTNFALPALLTGRRPGDPSAVPSTVDYPDNLFTLLRDQYRINAHEPITHLCPEGVCDRDGSESALATSLRLGNDAWDLWTDFAALERPRPDLQVAEGLEPAVPWANNFVRSLRPDAKPTFDFLHVLTPHSPWRYLPDLRDTGVISVDPGAELLSWSSAWSATSGRERHVLNTMAADRLLGRIRHRLERIGEWDDAAVVVTADHGIAFTAGEPLRTTSTRPPLPESARQVLWTPLFVKRPGQTGGVVDDRPMESIDVLPTIADMLGVRIPWKIDGVSARGPVRRDFTRRISSYGEIRADGVRLPPEDGRTHGYSPANFRSVLRERATIGTAGPRLRPYAIGPYAELLGDPVDGLTRTAPTAARIDIVNQEDFVDVDTTARTAPFAYLDGQVEGPAPPGIIAFVVNGKIAGFGKAETRIGHFQPTVWASLAPQFFRSGENRIEAFAVSGPVDAPTLAAVTLAGLP